MIDLATATDEQIRAHADSLLPAIEAYWMDEKRKASGKAYDEHRARVEQVEACYTELGRRCFARKTPEQQREVLTKLTKAIDMCAPPARKEGP